MVVTAMLSKLLLIEDRLSASEPVADVPFWIEGPRRVRSRHGAPWIHTWYLGDRLLV